MEISKQSGIVVSNTQLYVESNIWKWILIPGCIIFRTW